MLLTVILSCCSSTSINSSLCVFSSEYPHEWIITERHSHQQDILAHNHTLSHTFGGDKTLKKWKIRKKCIFLPGHPTSLISNTPHIEYIVQFHVNIILILRRSREISVWYVLSFLLVLCCFSVIHPDAGDWAAMLGGCHRWHGMVEGVVGINGKSYRIKI